eukprot:CAMPEP_0185837896 /NCGR_PEP_ID=MMETSP1353-20130828/12165_1 /TAXON_ID=1077150 /ORGANISM="Erythrolobus australicus, Strain CCMP3124" /LENGTH=46 /DNA_ID= /DNA_START= /DNA_END= /DNA_ORIENTATION=
MRRVVHGKTRGCTDVAADRARATLALYRDDSAFRRGVVEAQQRERA